jgi:hypothetical protein
LSQEGRSLSEVGRSLSQEGRSLSQEGRSLSEVVLSPSLLQSHSLRICVLPNISIIIELTDYCEFNLFALQKLKANEREFC